MMKDNDIGHQLTEMERSVSENHGCDLVCFGESYLHGFEGLTWDYDEDIKRAIRQDDPAILRIREMARQNRCGISFGFIEKTDGMLYSSNMVVDRDGEIIDVFRRVSPGWKTKIAGPEYQEGEGFHTFAYMGKKLVTAICGDIWHDHLLLELSKSDMDALLWPLYIDFSADEWLRTHETDYASRVQVLGCPALMVNSYVNDPKRSNGGCYIFHHGKTIGSLPMGGTGILQYQLDIPGVRD